MSGSFFPFLDHFVFKHGHFVFFESLTFWILSPVHCICSLSLHWATFSDMDCNLTLWAQFRLMYPLLSQPPLPLLRWECAMLWVWKNLQRKSHMSSCLMPQDLFKVQTWFTLVFFLRKSIPQEWCLLECVAQAEGLALRLSDIPLASTALHRGIFLGLPCPESHQGPGPHLSSCCGRTHWPFTL